MFGSAVHNLECITGLLSLTPNLHTLMTSSKTLNVGGKYVLFKDNKTFQLVSNANRIKILIIGKDLTLEEIKLFTDLCPRVEHLTICIGRHFLQRVLQFLLSKNNTKTRHLNSLLIKSTSEIPDQIMESLIASENLQVDYIIGRNEDEHLHDICIWL